MGYIGGCDEGASGLVCRSFHRHVMMMMRTCGWVWHGAEWQRAHAQSKRTIRAKFRSWDLWVMGPSRYHCATLIAFATTAGNSAPLQHCYHCRQLCICVQLSSSGGTYTACISEKRGAGSGAGAVRPARPTQSRRRAAVVQRVEGRGRDAQLVERVGRVRRSAHSARCAPITSAPSHPIACQAWHIAPLACSPQLGMSIASPFLGIVRGGSHCVAQCERC